MQAPWWLAPGNCRTLILSPTDCVSEPWPSAFSASCVCLPCCVQLHKRLRDVGWKRVVSESASCRQGTLPTKPENLGNEVNRVELCFRNWMLSLRSSGDCNKVSCSLWVCCKFYCLYLRIPKIEVAHLSESLLLFTSTVATFTRTPQSL
jgi:hypothetical protein